jgi:hypothetical protein
MKDHVRELHMLKHEMALAFRDASAIFSVDAGPRVPENTPDDDPSFTNCGVQIAVIDCPGATTFSRSSLCLSGT